MPAVESSVLVPALLPDVFAYASDWQRWSEWFEGATGFRPITEITRGNGARYEYTATLMGFRATVVTEIADFVENVGWTGIARRGMPHTTHWRFEACGDRARFTYGLDIHVPVPIIGAFIDRVVLEPQWRRIITASLANLQRHFEASPRPRAASDGA
jgi:Polyketide cyclase / dehydrase and lipid transport